MTNREYMESLSNKELADFLNKEPWSNEANMMWWNGFYSMTEAIEEWLNKEKKNND